MCVCVCVRARPRVCARVLLVSACVQTCTGKRVGVGVYN